MLATIRITVDHICCASFPGPSRWTFALNIVQKIYAGTIVHAAVRLTVLYIFVAFIPCPAGVTRTLESAIEIVTRSVVAYMRGGALVDVFIAL